MTCKKHTDGIIRTTPNNSIYFFAFAFVTLSMIRWSRGSSYHDRSDDHDDGANDKYNRKQHENRNVATVGRSNWR